MKTLSTFAKTAIAGITATAITLGAIPSAYAIDISPEAIPGADNLSTILSWIMWGGALVLFGYFMFGLVKAGKARNGHAEEKVEAPTWPLVAAVLLAAAPAIFTLLAGV